MTIGQQAIVEKVNQSAFSEKLMEMGCLKGTIIRMIMSAPLGDPMAFELEGYTLSMRRKEADTILVNLVKEDE